MPMWVTGIVNRPSVLTGPRGPVPLSRSLLPQPGFTLIEILLVLVIVSIMAGMATVALSPNPARDLDREGRRLQLVLQLAGDEAVAQGLELALALSPQDRSYQFLVFDIEKLQWSPLTSDEYGPHNLPEEVVASIEIEGQLLDQETVEQIQRMQQLADDNSPQPALLLLSSGEITPFKITLRHSLVADTISVVSDGVSGIELQ